jgi:hypothetical protein
MIQIVAGSEIIFDISLFIFSKILFTRYIKASKDPSPVFFVISSYQIYSEKLPHNPGYPGTNVAKKRFLESPGFL